MFAVVESLERRDQAHQSAAASDRPLATTGTVHTPCPTCRTLLAFPATAMPCTRPTECRSQWCGGRGVVDQPLVAVVEAQARASPSLAHSVLCASLVSRAVGSTPLLALEAGGHRDSDWLWPGEHAASATSQAESPAALPLPSLPAPVSAPPAPSTLSVRHALAHFFFPGKPCRTPGLCAHYDQVGMGQQTERDMTRPPVPSPHFILIKADFPFRLSKALFD